MAKVLRRGTCLLRCFIENLAVLMSIVDHREHTRVKTERLFTFEEKMGVTFQIRIPCGNPNQKPLLDQEVRSATLVSNTFLIRNHILKRDPTHSS